MPHPLTIPALSALALAGSGLGIYLGRSAVSEINPAYYASAAEGRFHADLGPSRYVAAEARLTPAAALSAAELDQGLGRGCIGCRSTPAEYYPVHASGDDGYRRDWARVAEAPVTPAALPAAVPTESELAAQAAEAAEHQAGLVAVHRYASFESAPAPEEAPVTQLAAAEPMTGLPQAE